MGNNEEVHNNPPPLITVKGSHREIGRQIGEACKEQILRHIENTRILIDQSYEALELTWDQAKIQARKYLPFAQERYPQYVDEMQGLADGSGALFDDIVVINVLEAVTMDALHLSKCTSMAVNSEFSTNEHVLVAHNEDWLPEDESVVYLLQIIANDEPPILSMTYGALLANIGVNAYGIAQCCDSVYPNDSRIGIPRVIVSRAVLAARTPGEAMRSMLVPRRAAGYNHLLVHESGEIYCVEVSARRFAVLYAYEGVIAHTNHYLDPHMQEIEDEPDELVGTRIRYFRALRLLRRTPQHTVHTLQAILQDHVNYPNSICNHMEDDTLPLDREKTINSMVIDLSERIMYLAWGNPCRNDYHVFSLDS